MYRRDRVLVNVGPVDLSEASGEIIVGIEGAPRLPCLSRPAAVVRTAAASAVFICTRAGPGPVYSKRDLSNMRIQWPWRTHFNLKLRPVIMHDVETAQKVSTYAYVLITGSRPGY